MYKYCVGEMQNADTGMLNKNTDVNAAADDSSGTYQNHLSRVISGTYRAKL
jgi:hypothetical protein